MFSFCLEVSSFSSFSLSYNCGYWAFPILYTYSYSLHIIIDILLFRVSFSPQAILANAIDNAIRAPKIYIILYTLMATLAFAILIKF